MSPTARKKSFDDIDAVAQGRVWAGVDAAQHGLVDHLGSYKDALNAAAKRAKLGDDYKVQYIEPPLGWREAIALQSQALAARFARCAGAGASVVEPGAALVRAAGGGAGAAVAVHGPEAGVLLLSVCGELEESG